MPAGWYHRSVPTTPEDGFFPLWARFGRFLLFGVFVSLLAGRFTLNRISTTLPAADLRWVMLGAIVTLGIVWYGGAAAYLPDRHTNPGTPLFVVWAAWMATSTLWAQPDAELHSPSRTSSFSSRSSSWPLFS